MPSNLHFIKADVLESDFREKTNYRVEQLIDALYPSSHCKAIEVCRALIDELGIKGEVTEDFIDWDDLLKHKALTSSTVEQVIINFTIPKGGSRLDIDFDAIAQEIGYTKYIPRANLRNAFDRYRQSRFVYRSVHQLDLTRNINRVIKGEKSSAGDDFTLLLGNVINKLPSEVVDSFSTTDELKAAVIFEYIIDSDS